MGGSGAVGKHPTVSAMLLTDSLPIGGDKYVSQISFRPQFFEWNKIELQKMSFFKLKTINSLCIEDW